MFASQNKFESAEDDYESGHEQAAESNVASEDDSYHNYVDAEWARLYEKATDYMHTTIFATTGNQLRDNLRRLASRVTQEVAHSHRKAIVIQIVSNRDQGVTTRAMFRGEINTIL